MGRRKGVVGCLDPGGRFSNDLGSWVAEDGAAALFMEEGMGLWVWPSEEATYRLLQTDSLCILVQGDVFEVERTSTAMATSDNLLEELASAYRQDGPDFVKQITGQFSLILLDRRQRRAMLYRDETGSNPLYYSAMPASGIVFSNLLDLIVASPAVEKRISRTSLHEYLRFLDISAPNTIYDQVAAIEPGTLCLCDERGLRTRQYDLRPVRGEQTESVETVVMELERRLQTAVSKRASRGSPMVVFLSGGVDSALLCAMTAELEDVGATALTVGFAEQTLDESPVAQAIAAQLKISHRILSFPMNACQEAFEDLTAGIQYPFADPAAVPTLLAFRHARGIGSIAFDGTGADGLFGAMPPRHQRWAIAYGALLPKTLRSQATRLMKALPLLRGYTPILDFEEPQQILIRWRGWMRPEIERLCGEPVSFDHTRFYRVFRAYRRLDHFERYRALLRSMPDDRLHEVAALTDVVVRFPYQDPTVREYVLGLKAEYLYGAGESKRVLKAVLERHIPRAIWDVPKHGFHFPFVDLMTAEDHALVRKYLDPEVTERWGLFDPESLRSTVDAFLGGERTSPFAQGSPAFRVWALVVLFAWLENHYQYL